MKSYPEIDELISRYPALSGSIEAIEAVCRLLIRGFKADRKLLVCGNGGSSADADHIVGELMKGFMKKRPIEKKLADKLANLFPDEGPMIGNKLQKALPAISLSSQSALISAFGNDVSPDLIYAQQTGGYGKKSDIFMGISTSGSSKNVVYAAMTASALGMATIGLTGPDGGKLSEICDHTIMVPGNNVPEIQEYHLPVYHTICRIVESAIFIE